MRKALIAVIVASALFAVGAFAAELTVQSDDVASGQADVGPCGDAEVTWTTNQTVDANGDWAVTQATVDFSDTDCDGAKVDLAIGLNSNGSVDESRDEWLDWSCTDVSSKSSTCTAPSTAQQPPVVQVVEVSVLANGNSINATVAA